MPESLLLTFVIPAYNLGEWLDKCLSSLIMQTTGGNWEAIIINDGSRDDTGTRADNFGKKDKRFRVFHGVNEGVNNARAKGLAHASGKYVWFVDGDDQLHPQAVKILSEHLRIHPDIDIVFVDEITSNDIASEKLPEHISFQEFTGAYQNVRMLNIHSSIYKRNLIKDQQFDNYLVGEDLLFAQKQLVRAQKVHYLQVPLYGYISRPSSIMHSPSPLRSSHGIAATFDLICFYAQYGKMLSSIQKKQVVHAFLFSIPNEILSFQHPFRQSLIDEWYSSLCRIPEISFQSRAKTLWKLERILGHKPLSRLLIVHFNATIFRTYQFCRKLF